MLKMEEGFLLAITADKSSHNVVSNYNWSENSCILREKVDFSLEDPKQICPPFFNNYPPQFFFLSQNQHFLFFIWFFIFQFKLENEIGSTGSKWNIFEEGRYFHWLCVFNWKHNLLLVNGFNRQLLSRPSSNYCGFLLKCSAFIAAVGFWIGEGPWKSITVE